MDARDVIHSETTIEREALKTFRRLRGSGLPVLVSRWQIYRVRIRSDGSLDSERFAYIQAFSAKDACERVAGAATGFDRVLLSDVRSRVTAKSYEECLREGLSTDLELRLFEIGWSAGRVTAWVSEPMFLLARTSGLTLKWAGFQKALLR